MRKEYMLVHSYSAHEERYRDEWEEVHGAVLEIVRKKDVLKAYQYCGNKTLTHLDVWNEKYSNSSFCAFTF